MPPPDPSTLMSNPDSARRTVTNSASGGGAAVAGVSSSVPVDATAYTHPSSTRPRMHDYSIPMNSTSTHIRPGLFGVVTASSGGANIPVTTDSVQTQPMSVPITTSPSSYSWSSVGLSQTNNHHVNSFSVDTGAGTWSLPRSAVRSISGSLHSRSGSTSDIDEQEEQEGEHPMILANGDEAGDDDSSSAVDDEFDPYGNSTLFGSARREYDFGVYSHHRTLPTWKHEDEDVAGLENRKGQAGGESKEWDEMEMEMDMD